MGIKLFIYASFLLTICIIALSVAHGFENYTSVCGDDKLCASGTGFFNEQLTQYDVAGRTLTSPKVTPLVDNLDGQGVPEIIALDGTTVRLYHGKDLDVVNAYTSSNISTTAPYMITYDIDGDGLSEIITASSSGKLEILQYNTTFTLQNSYSVGSSIGESMISCSGTEKCIWVYTDTLSATTGTAFVYARMFNSTDLGSRATILSNSLGTSRRANCLPKIPYISTKDYDIDSNVEYIFSVFRGVISSPEIDDDMIVFYLQENSSFGVVQERNITITNSGDFTQLNVNGCDSRNYGRHLTSPFVYDIDFSSGNGLETVIGFSTDFDEYEMRSYLSTGTSITVYPFLSDADGEIVSNIFLATASDGTPQAEFCLLGYKNSTGEIDLLCGSEINSFTGANNLEYSYTPPYNVSSTFGKYNVLSHSANHKSSDSPNIDEMVNSYGVFDLDYSSCTLTFCDLNLIFDNPKDDAVVISVDAENQGRDDLLALTSGNLWYIDDGFSNTPGQITNYRINPCIDSTWRQNTTVQVQITVEDIDSDTVRADTILYYNGLEPQESGFFPYSASGTTFIHTFIANQTVGSSILRLIGQDSANPDTNDTIDLTFSVASQGVSFGDCVTDISIDLATGNVTDLEGALLDTQTDNIVTKNINRISAFSGLGGTVVWLILMIAAAFSIWVSSHRHDSFTFGVVAIVELFMLILGVKLSMIGIGTLIIVTIIGVIIVTLAFRKSFTGG